VVKKIRHAEEDELLGSVYGSRSMSRPLPKYRLPDESLPAPLAYQLVHDQLNLDMKPDQNLASFVTTWVEPEAEKLILESMRFNLANEEEYPHVIQIEERCVNMLARLYHAERHQEAVGVATIGSSEAVMLGGLALKWRWRAHRRNAGLPADRPNIVMGESVQVVWEKFARYFDVEPRYIPVEKGRYVLTPEDVARAVDENTIGVCAILGSTFTGEFEPVEEISEALDRVQAEQGWDIPIHVDAASGGFVAPFLYPHLRWDFRLPRVASINVSGHKYGLVYPGLGWVLWRDQAALPEELIFHVNYLGGDLPTFTLNFSRPASPVIAQYYNFLRLGREGYTRIMENLRTVSNFLAEKIEATGVCTVLGSREALPLVPFTVRADAGFTVFQLSDKLREFGWFLPAYTMPKNATDIAVMRIVVRENLSRDLADSLLADLGRAIAELRGAGAVSRHGKPGHKSKRPC
jgi:glutamate decarboxylase